MQKMASDVINFEVEFEKESNLGNLSEAESMEEDNVSIGESSIDGSCKETVEKETSIQNSVEETAKRKMKEIVPKPIMVLEIEDIINFTAKLEADCEENFSTKILGRWLKIIPNTFAAKVKIQLSQVTKVPILHSSQFGSST